MMRWIRIAVALCLVAALGVSTYLGFAPFAAATGLVVVALAYGWPRLTDSPQPRATSIMILLLGLVGLGTAWSAERVPYLEWLPLLAGVGLLWSFIQHLMRGLDASDAVANVSAQVAGLVITLSAASWIAAIRLPGDREAVLAGLVALILAQAAAALPWPARYTSPLAIVVAAAGAASVGAGLFGGVLSVWEALGLGFVMGLLVAAVDRMLGMIAVSRFQAGEIERARRRDKARRLAVQTALGAAPIAMGGIVVYVLERILAFR